MNRSPAAGFALVLFILCLALQVQPAGWGALYNETDGQYAGAARVMATGGDWLIPENNGVPRLVKPPLLYWLIASSFEIFGVTEFAARLPSALGVTAWILATFLIGTHLATAWRGFLAGVILLTCLGSATLARIVMPEPVFCAFITLAIYFGLRGLDAPERRASARWMIGLWTFGALACFTKGLHGLLFPLGIVALTAAFTPTDRARLPRLLSPVGIVIFLVINVPWYLHIESRYPGVLANLFLTEQLGHVTGSDAPATSYTNVPRWQFLLLHVVWLFPWSIIALAELARRSLGSPQVDVSSGSPSQKNFTLPVVWIAAIILPVLLAGQRQDYYAMAAWPAFALAVAALVDRGISWVGLSAFAAVCLAALFLLPDGSAAANGPAAVAERSTAWTTMTGLDAAAWDSLSQLGRFSLGCALAALAFAAVLIVRRRPQLALRATLLAAAAVSFGAMAGYARVAPYFSVAEMAPVLRELAARGVPIAYDGGIDTGSSLLFYATNQILLIDQDPENDFITRKFAIGRDRYVTAPEFATRWQSGQSLALVTETSRLPAWQHTLGPNLPPPAAQSGTQILLLTSP